MTNNDQEINDLQMPLIEHFKELKRRIIICLIGFFLAFGISYYFASEIYQFLVEPLADLYHGQEDRKLIYTGMAEAFMTYIKVSLFAAFILSFPIIAYQIYSFLAPGMYRDEKMFMVPFLFSAPVLFILGAALAYYFIFPLAWGFFLSFEEMGTNGDLPIKLEARVSEYLSLVMRMIFAFGLSFQLPIILALLTKAGFINAESLKTKRKFAVILIFVVAAILTPPDVISQIGLALPLLILYECSIFACMAVEKKRKSELEKVEKNA